MSSATYDVPPIHDYTIDQVKPNQNEVIILRNGDMNVDIVTKGFRGALVLRTMNIDEFNSLFSEKSIDNAILAIEAMNKKDKEIATGKRDPYASPTRHTVPYKLHTPTYGGKRARRALRKKRTLRKKRAGRKTRRRH